MTQTINSPAFDITDFTLSFPNLGKDSARIGLLHTESNQSYEITVARVGCFERTLFCFFRACFCFFTLGCCDYKERYYSLKDTNSDAECWVRISDVSNAYQNALNSLVEQGNIPDSELPTLGRREPVFQAPAQMPPASPSATVPSAQQIAPIEPAQSTSTPSLSSSPHSVTTLPSLSIAIPRTKFDPSQLTAEEIGPMSQLLKNKLTEYLYTNKKLTCIFCFNHPSDANAILIAESVLNRFPPGFYFCCRTEVPRIKEKVKENVYKAFQEFAETPPFLVVTHYATSFQTLFNINSDWLKPQDSCQLLYQGPNDSLALYSSPQMVRDIATIDRWSKVNPEQSSQAVQRALKKVEQAMTQSDVLPISLGRPSFTEMPTPVIQSDDRQLKFAQRIQSACDSLRKYGISNQDEAYILLKMFETSVRQHITA